MFYSQIVLLFLISYNNIKTIYVFGGKMTESNNTIYFIEQFKKYYSKNDASISYDVSEEKRDKLQNWIYSQLYRIKIGSITDEEVILLKANDINLGIRPLLWNEWYQMLSDYFKNSENNYIPESYVVEKNYKLGKWAIRQFRNFKKLNDEQKKLLEQLSWDKIQLLKEQQKRAENYRKALEKKEQIMAEKKHAKKKRKDWN